MGRHEYYEVANGKAEPKRDYCPKCGDGVYLAEHKDRRSCGKCGYTEFTKNK
jgi:small subunit ribosomal protein S27Ae